VFKLEEADMGIDSAALDRDVALRLRAEDFYAEYAHTIDDDRLEDWPALFTENGTYRVTTRENFDSGLPLALIYCDGRGMMEDRISALRTANIYEPHVYCHSTSALRVLGILGGEIRARANFMVLRTMAEGDMAIFASGRYFDRLVEEGGRLKFRERIAVLDSRQVDTLLVVPL
jgi:anthranilate 1,2-dioxygenase small subunit